MSGTFNSFDDFIARYTSVRQSSAQNKNRTMETKQIAKTYLAEISDEKLFFEQAQNYSTRLPTNRTNERFGLIDALLDTIPLCQQADTKRNGVDQVLDLLMPLAKWNDADENKTVTATRFALVQENALHVYKDIAGKTSEQSNRAQSLWHLAMNNLYKAHNASAKSVLDALIAYAPNLPPFVSNKMAEFNERENKMLRAAGFDPEDVALPYKPVRGNPPKSTSSPPTTTRH